MTSATRYRLARPGLRIPMPDRGYRLFSAEPAGEAVDTGSRFYRTLIDDGDIVPVAVSPKTPRVRAQKTKGKTG